LYGDKIIINNWKFTADGKIATDQEVLESIDGAYFLKLDTRLPDVYQRLDKI